MQYGSYELVKNVKNIILTKIFHHKARLIRYPCYIRNGKNIFFNEGFTCGYNCRFEVIKDENSIGTIIFGKNCRLGDNVHVTSANEVIIGENALIASKVYITDCSHGDYLCNRLYENPSFDNPAKRPIVSKQTRIGNNVWLGENVVILAGVSIGDGCILGASSVVTKDIPNNCIAVGNPAKVIKKYDLKSKKWIKVL